MPSTVPAQAPGRYAQWLDALKALHAGQRAMRGYATLDDVARRLMKTNPRLQADKAQWLAGHWARQDVQGLWQIQGHAAHRLPSAQLYRVDETLEIFKRISAPTLCVEATDSDMGGFWKGAYSLTEFHERLQAVPHCELAQITQAGHMLHHDQPQQVAALIERFIA